LKAVIRVVFIVLVTARRGHDHTRRPDANAHSNGNLPSTATLTTEAAAQTRTSQPGAECVGEVGLADIQYNSGQAENPLNDNYAAWNCPITVPNYSTFGTTYCARIHPDNNHTTKNSQCELYRRTGAALSLVGTVTVPPGFDAVVGTTVTVSNFDSIYWLCIVPGRPPLGGIPPTYGSASAVRAFYTSPGTCN
jgi:hypothetical protein